MIRKASPSDIEGICKIYNKEIQSGYATFEYDDLSLQELQKRVDKVQENGEWLVWKQDNLVAGYAYSAPYHPREGYKFTQLISVYVSPEFHGQGIAKSLYIELFSILRKKGIRSLIAYIVIPNEASIRLHLKFGFKEVGHLQKVGYKFDTWYDIKIFQKLL